jgi:indolepyruvate ferredoxin oxidoreductase alpha subunit
MRTEVLEKSGKKAVLLGNEAIARGALEAGVGVVTAYPGTPSSEVPMVLSRVAKDMGFYFEYSTNEKVALETAVGAAWSGVRSLVAMKHFGLNVASDSLMPIAYAGVKGGLIIMVADDPQAYSSVQSEQDSRYYARMARLPEIEPSNPQECLDLTRLAFDLSEEFEIPVLLRTTTKVSHSIGTVKLGELGRIKNKGEFRKDPDRFYNFRPHLQVLHKRLEEKLGKIEEKYGRKLNKLIDGKGSVGIIASGVSFEYVKEASQELGINPPVAKIGLTHPASKKFIGDVVKDKKAILVVEELEPILEDFVKIVAKDVNPSLKVYGKNLLPRVGEYNLEIVIAALQKVFGKKFRIDFEAHKKGVEKAVDGLPPRKPVFCPGCPHRSTFYAVKKVFGSSTSSGQAGAIFAGDIGCYMLGAFEPFKMQDFIISMGAGVGLAHGISRVSDQELVVFIGDSTFFHAGMPGVLNYRFNNGNSPLVVVLDNQITAMTGHQPHPGSGFTGMGEKAEAVKIEDVIKAFRAEVRVANAFSQKDLIKALKELKEIRGPRVLVSRGECRLLTKRRFRKKGVPLPKFEIVDQKEFEKSGLMNEFACPAMEKTDKGYRINPDLCWGCAVCSQICPKGIKLKGK